MTGAEINFKVAAQQGVANQAPPLKVAGLRNAKTTAVPTTSAQDLSREVAMRKDESLMQLEHTQKDLKDAIEMLNKSLKPIPTSLHISVDDASNRFVVNITDTNTGELIRKVPSDAILRVAANIESLRGILFDAYT